MLIVFNPAAGRRRRRRLDRALAALRQAGLQPVVQETTCAGHAALLARTAAAQGERLIVAAGGDGTIAEVAGAIAGSGAALGILPLGTANVLAWELGIPMRPEAAAAVLHAGHRVLLRPGIAHTADGGTRLFVQMLGAGFDAAVVAGLDLRLKRAIGKAAYVWHSLRELARYPFGLIEVRLDGQRHRVASVIVTKGRLYAGRFRLAPAADPLAPGFQVALFRHDGAWGGALGAALAGVALPLGLLPRLPGLTLHRADRIEITGPAVPVQMDGDAAGHLPVSVADSPHPIAVLVPAVR